jgi:excisionase family DNA binding protein
MNLPKNKRQAPSEFVPALPAVGARSADQQRLTLSVEDAGRILGISRGAAYARAGDGTLPTIRLGKRILVPKEALNKMLTVK